MFSTSQIVIGNSRQPKLNVQSALATVRLLKEALAKKDMVTYSMLFSTLADNEKVDIQNLLTRPYSRLEIPEHYFVEALDETDVWALWNNLSNLGVINSHIRKEVGLHEFVVHNNITKPELTYLAGLISEHLTIK